MSRQRWIYAAWGCVLLSGLCATSMAFFAPAVAPLYATAVAIASLAGGAVSLAGYVFSA